MRAEILSKTSRFNSTQSIEDRSASFDSTQRRKDAKTQSSENLSQHDLRLSKKNVLFFKFVCLKSVFKQTNSKNNTFFLDSLRSCCDRFSNLCAFASLRLCVESKLALLSSILRVESKLDVLLKTLTSSCLCVKSVVGYD